MHRISLDSHLYTNANDEELKIKSGPKVYISLINPNSLSLITGKNYYYLLAKFKTAIVNSAQNDTVLTVTFLLIPFEEIKKCYTYLIEYFSPSLKVVGFRKYRRQLFKQFHLLPTQQLTLIQPQQENKMHSAYTLLYKDYTVTLNKVL